GRSGTSPPSTCRRRTAPAPASTCSSARATCSPSSSVRSAGRRSPASPSTSRRTAGSSSGSAWTAATRPTTSRPTPTRPGSGSSNAEAPGTSDRPTTASWWGSSAAPEADAAPQPASAVGAAAAGFVVHLRVLRGLLLGAEHGHLPGGGGMAAGVLLRGDRGEQEDGVLERLDGVAEVGEGLERAGLEHHRVLPRPRAPRRRGGSG